jgi:PST family polysaccharide transporter
LGSQWAAAAPIFVCLGFAALVQPFNSTVAWLFVSQGRTGELARWGFWSACVCSAAFVAGLRWGPAGVALGYALAEIIFGTVPLWWWAGRNGPVSFAHIWKTAVVFVPSLVAAGAAAHLAHRWLELPAALELGACAVISYAVYGAMLSVSRTGREILGEAIELITEAGSRVGRRAKAAAQDG